jgi:dihydrofolate synthase / folylpolyglutamate synthase
MQFKTMLQFEAYLKARIPTREALFVGDLGLQRAKYFMKLLGNPQNKLQVIHIAGTSGKGSTASLTSHLLQSQGFRVGLFISPHILDIRERLQIDNQLPSEKLILKYFNQILPIILKMEKCRYGTPTYFEILAGLAYFIFAKEKLNYAVIETGLGGRLDGTNTVTSKNKIAIITKLGLDHTEVLGNTLAKIASEKAGIIKAQNTVINIQQSTNTQSIINKKCQKKNANLFTIKDGKNYKLISSTKTATIFDFNFANSELNSDSELSSEAPFKLRNTQLNLIGAHQIENCSLALACLSALANRDKFTINEKKMRSALQKISIPGRMEIRKNGKNFFIIDGAHNPQKMTAFISSLRLIFPNQKFDFILAFKKGKDFKKILKKILPLANHVFLTSFSTANQADHWSSVDTAEIASYFKTEKFKNFSTIKNNETEILTTIQNSKSSIALTGSLYLIGSIYKYLK